jgi:hypothetical protein
MIITIRIGSWIGRISGEELRLRRAIWGANEPVEYEWAPDGCGGW